jgi:uncharacterized Zn ribbon protein
MDIEFQGCEHCDKEYSIEDMTMMGEFLLCPPCVDEWQGVFNVCKHEWEPEIDEMGDDGQYCTKCCGFVRNGDFPILFGKPAPGTPNPAPCV